MRHWVVIAILTGMVMALGSACRPAEHVTRDTAENPVADAAPTGSPDASQDTQQSQQRPSQPFTQADADAVAAASRVHFFEGSSLQGQELSDVLRDTPRAVAMATADRQGVPTVSLMTPTVITQDVLLFSIGDTQTRRNLLHNGLAAAAVYLYQPTDSPSQQYRGARLVLGLITDEQELEGLADYVGDLPENALFLRVLRIIPLG